MRKSRYVDISGWLDRDHIALRAEGLPVDPIEALKNMEYDFVLIAIANAEAAKQVFESLKCAGVMPDKIIWRAEDYQRVYNRQMSIVNKRMEIYDQVAGQSNKKIFLFMTPEHGNMGDYAIAMAERSFLRGCFSEWLLIEATTPDWQNFRTEYKKLVSKEDIIFISGGGFLGDMWENGRIVKEILNSFTENIKFMFPNTLTYKNNAENAMRSDAEFYFMQDKLYIMARERKSCERLRQYGYRPENQIALFPDMALTLEERFSEEEHREGVLLCFRNDVEKTYPDKSIEKIKRRLMEWELPYVETDMHLHKKVRRLEGEYQVRKKMKEFKRSRLVITDRLHGMIFAAITETPCIAFNNSTDKVVGVYEWIKELPYICFWEGEDIPERQIRELYELKACQYENRHIHNEMVHMVEWIKSMKERNK